MPQITLPDFSLSKHSLTDRVKQLKRIYFDATPQICAERPRLVTDYTVSHGFLSQGRISILDKARAYRHVLEHRDPVVRHRKACNKDMELFDIDDTSLFAGSTTSKFKGVPLYPEFLALALWPELHTISQRPSNPYHITPEDIRTLNRDVFPHWMDHNITEIARQRCYQQAPPDEHGRPRAPQMKLLERLVFFLASKPNCISHTIPDFSRAINRGLRAMMDEASEKKSAASDGSKKEFYVAIAEVAQGIIAYSHRLAADAEKLASAEADPGRKQELLDIAAIHRHVPEHPARTFREGLTTVWLCWIAIHLENPNVGLSLGRLDQILYPLYRNDIDNGTLGANQTEAIDRAIELLCCLWLKIGDHVPAMPEAAEQLFGGTGSNQAITIGGVDTDGRDAVNDLTYVMLRAIELLRLRDPNLNARYYHGINSPEYLRRLCEANVNTGATPAIHNDKAVIAALTAKGDSLGHARDYGVIGCVEPGSNGRSYGHTAAILLNLTSAFELTLFNGRHRHTGPDLIISEETGDPTTFTSIHQFKRAFEKQILWLVDQTTELNNILGRVHQDFYPTPILSAFFEGPMEKGKDLIQGGAVINSSGATIIGLADVADSLTAIQTVVFEEGSWTFAQLRDALENNFAGHADLQKRLACEERTPKYGNDDDTADENVAWLVELLDRAFAAKTNYRGAPYRVGYWSMTNHAGFGKFMGATPNGRMARESFSSGITPVSKVTSSLAKALSSVAKLPPRWLSNGVALNLKYAPDHDPNMLDNFVATVGAYFASRPEQPEGGMEIQFNITDHDTFVKAVHHPEDYPELLVRVSGYTAYFRDLNPQMQKEIIDRTEYLLSTGRADPYPPFPLTRRLGVV